MAKRKVSTKKKVTIEQDNGTKSFGLTLEVGGKVYTSSGSDIESTLLALQRPQKITGKGTLTIRKGDRTRERVLVMNQIKRLFYPLAQKVLAKQLVVGL